MHAFRKSTQLALVEQPDQEEVGELQLQELPTATHVMDDVVYLPVHRR